MKPCVYGFGRQCITCCQNLTVEHLIGVWSVISGLRKLRQKNGEVKASLRNIANSIRKCLTGKVFQDLLLQ
jgi:hypothetical protein